MRFVIGGEENWKRSGAREVGFAFWEAAEEGIEREAFVLPVVSKKDGISGNGGGAVSGGHDISGNPCGLFGGAARTPKVSASLPERMSPSPFRKGPSCLGDHPQRDPQTRKEGPLFGMGGINCVGWSNP